MIMLAKAKYPADTLEAMLTANNARIR